MEAAKKVIVDTVKNQGLAHTAQFATTLKWKEKALIEIVV